jgi:hypothetical protein
MKAFPHKVYLETTDPTVQNPVIHAGMDLRDYFAAKVMPYLMRPRNLSEIKVEESWEDFCARKSYEYADAMMKAREQ